MTTHDESDLLIIGGGPAGLCAAIQASSEGLSTRLVDNGAFLGGQAKESNAIENYPGFPQGITGEALMGNIVEQALRFRTEFACPVGIAKLTRDKTADRIVAYSEDYQEFVAKACILSTGLSYRRLAAEGVSTLMGRGVYYGAPSAVLPMDSDCKVAIVGGANSAGQAAVKIAQNSGATVNLFIRKTIKDQMSTYLIERLAAKPNVNLFEGCEVTKVEGHKNLSQITYRCNGEIKTLPMDYMFIFIGATPRTFWLGDSIALDSNKYITTGTGMLEFGNRDPFPFETSMPGVFAAGDVRSGSTKRVAAACGEGAGALQNIHQLLAM